MHVRGSLPLLMLLAVAVPAVGGAQSATQVLRGQAVDDGTQLEQFLMPSMTGKE